MTDFNQKDLSQAMEYYQAILDSDRTTDGQKANARIALQGLEVAAAKFGLPESNGHSPNGESPQEEAIETEFYLTQSADDEGNAQCLVSRYPNVFLYTDSHGWMLYNGRFWQRDGAEAVLDRHVVEMLQERRLAAVAAQAEAIVKATRPSSYNLKGCKALLKSLVYASVSEFDNDKDLLNCNNGVINLRTGRFEPHNPAQRFTYCLSTNYNPEADEETWAHWLYDVLTPEALSGDNSPYVAIAAWLQMAVGYSLTGHTNEEILFYIHGDTRAGKGTFTETLLKMIGTPLAIEADFDTFTMKRDPDANNFDMAGLKASRFVAASETNKYQSLNPKRIKAATGGNAIRCSFKHRDHFDYWPQFKIWLSSNESVNADADDDAIWGRVKVIEFPNSYLGREDKALKQKMLQEDTLEGVLLWATKGAAEWYKTLPGGLKDPPGIEKSTQRHRTANDEVGQFLCETYENSTGDYVSYPDLYAKYESWCQENGVTPKKKKSLTASLNRKGYETGGKEHREIVGGKQVQVVRGLKLTL